MTNYPLRTHIHIHTRSCFPRFLQSCPQSSRTQAATCKATFSFDLRSRSGLQGLPIDTAIAAPSACLQLVPHHFTAGNAARHFRAPVRWLEVIHIVKPQQPYRARDSMASSASADVAAQPVDSGGPTSTDTAAAAAASDGWYYLMEGQHLGPFSTEQLLGEAVQLTLEITAWTQFTTAAPLSYFVATECRDTDLPCRILHHWLYGSQLAGMAPGAQRVVAVERCTGASCRPCVCAFSRQGRRFCNLCDQQGRRERYGELNGSCCNSVCSSSARTERDGAGGECCVSSAGSHGRLPRRNQNHRSGETCCNAPTYPQRR